MNNTHNRIAEMLEDRVVAWADKYDVEREGHDFWVSRQKPARDGVPLYTAPKREWVGLTDEDEEQCRVKAAATYHRHKYSVRGQQISPADNLEWHFVRAIEAKLKEKNGY